MWVETLRLENIRCFEAAELGLAPAGSRPRWITFLGENGTGKSTALQALALLLAGPEGAQKLLPRPLGWLRDEGHPGKISTRIHQDDNDPGRFGEDNGLRGFGYTFFVTGSRRVNIRNKAFTEPTIVPSGEKRLAWLRQNALTSKGHGWFAVAYGPFRRLSRSSQIMVPTLAPQSRYTNFLTLFSEDEALSIFERWMVYLDYRIAKEQDQEAERVRDIGVAASGSGAKQGAVDEAGGRAGAVEGCRNPRDFGGKPPRGQGRIP